ncbi:uncharacterized [Tachysurus ichikawai]
MSRSLFIRVPHVSLLLLSGFGTKQSREMPTPQIPPQNNKERRRNSDLAFTGMEECKEKGNEGGRVECNEGVNEGGKSCLDDQ